MSSPGSDDVPARSEPDSSTPDAAPDTEPSQETSSQGAAQSTPQRPPAIITAAQAKRLRSSVVGLLIAMGVTIAVVIPIILLAPGQRAENYHRNIDVAAVAEQAQGVAPFRPVDASPDGWTQNYARYNAGTATGIANWEVGYLTPGGHFIALTQAAADDANPTWIAQAADSAPVTGEQQIGGVNWETRGRGDDSPRSLIGAIAGSTVVLKGEADEGEFAFLATEVERSLNTRPSPASTPQQTPTDTPPPTNTPAATAPEATSGAGTPRSSGQ